MGRNGTALHDDEDIPPRLVLSHSEGESSSNEAEFRPNLRDISLSSVSEYPTSVVETSDVFDISHSLCKLNFLQLIFNLSMQALYLNQTLMQNPQQTILSCDSAELDSSDFALAKSKLESAAETNAAQRTRQVLKIKPNQT